MKPVCFFLCLLLIAGSAAAQTKAKPRAIELGNIVSDPGTVNIDLGNKLGLPSIQASASVIEIRLYSGMGFPAAQCVLIQYDKVWKASRYKLNAKDSAVRTTLKPAGGVEAIARTMPGMNVFALPSQQALNAVSYQLDPATNEVKMNAVNISDGPCYTVQFKVGDKSREYRYCDPKAYAAFYKGQREYSDFLNILKAFSRLEAK